MAVEPRLHNESVDLCLRQSGGRRFPGLAGTHEQVTGYILAGAAITIVAVSLVSGAKLKMRRKQRTGDSSKARPSRELGGCLRAGAQVCIRAQLQSTCSCHPERSEGPARCRLGSARQIVTQITAGQVLASLGKTVIYTAPVAPVSSPWIYRCQSSTLVKSRFFFIPRCGKAYSSELIRSGYPCWRPRHCYNLTA